MKQRFEENKC